jgi:SAM-dependent methyltransferase
MIQVSMSEKRDLDKAALCGEPSYVWRAGQQRRLDMILKAAGERVNGLILENGCGVGMYVDHLAKATGIVYGLEYDFERAIAAQEIAQRLQNAFILNAAGEFLPFPDNSFDLIISHEVLEHVQDDRLAVREMVRTLKKQGRMIIFVPNRGYPYETHGIYWRRRYHFGNIPLVNYLPRNWRNQLAPHVRVYSSSDLTRLFEGMSVKIISRTVIFGAYDNIIARFPELGKGLRTFLHALEKSPMRIFGLSHFWVVEKT